jgi:gamma-glutamyl hercynylcysteine S-oxide synthase
MDVGYSISSDQLAAAVHDARERTLALVLDLLDDQLMGPRLAIVNPLRWEIGHIAWFQEKWVLRHLAGQPSLLAEADALYDSMAIPHDTRWDLPLLSREATLGYLRDVRDAVLKQLSGRELSPEEVYFNLLAVFHEDMHTEAFTYTRQTLGYPPPGGFRADRAGNEEGGGPLPGDVNVPGGTFLLGATPAEPFVFDNEKWAHPVEVAPFAIARAPVTQAEFARFVEAGGYQRREWWSDEGWQWRQSANTEGPVYWRREPDGSWSRRDFDRWTPLEPHRPVLHVNWHEADAYCRWAGRRLPTEAEWEMAAAWDPATGHKRRYPWGDDPPTPQRANLDWGWAVVSRESLVVSKDGTASASRTTDDLQLSTHHSPACLDVGALAAGDSAVGCRQMIGNVWEWTASDFLPFAGFAADPYKDYSQPWFGTRKVLRGGCWATSARIARPAYRNFFTPDRNDVFAGFRTCAM